MTIPENPTAVGTVTRLRFEHLREPLGIGTGTPRLSWQVKTEVAGWFQAAYEIEAYAADGRFLSSTGRVESDESVLVAWPFAPLTSREQRQLRVRVWDAAGNLCDWSDLTSVEVGLLDPADWQAQFITPAGEVNPTAAPAPLLRRPFTLTAPIHQARLYITALGVYEAEINGQRVGDHLLAPGWTDYPNRLRYQTFDVTELLQEGENVLGAMLGDGWFHGRFGFGGGRRHIYGDRLALLAQLEVTHPDGTVTRILSDESWRTAVGPVISSDIYDGETYDARREQTGWSTAVFNDSHWQDVQTVNRDLATLIAPQGPPVRRTQIVPPVAITQSPLGKTIVDFGQNLVGWLRLTVQGAAGTTITLRHAEVLEDGELCVRPLRTALATDTYILKGAGRETWEPRFTFHGFRYAEVTGWPGEVTPEAIQAVVCHTDLERTGWFECSDPLLNRLHENTVWSMRGNFLDVPTDCPQRDERMGWTGDIQVFTPTAAFLYDVAGFLTSWLGNLAAEQGKTGGIVPFVVPNILPGTPPPTAAWGDAAVFVPWVLYQRYGDRQLLAEQFESMRSWVDVVATAAGADHLWDTGFQFGDWLDPAAPPESPGAARTPSFIIATAYLARSAELLGQTAGILGKTDVQTHYLDLAQTVRAAFNQQYVTPAGWLLSDSATAYALALQFALLPDATQRQQAGQRLASVVRANGYRISTGFVGTPLICDALCSVGLVDVAYRLLLTRECPSWLYPVTMGATTIWERWDSLLPDGSVNPGKMTSFNHYALGAVADWMHRTIGGLAPAAPGYRHLTMQPQPGGGLTQAAAHHQTPYGLASCSWEIEAGQITVEVEVPPNSTAEIMLPGQTETVQVKAGKHRWQYAYEAAGGKRPFLTVDSLVGDLIDDPEAGPLAIAAIRQHGTELADQMFAQETLSVREAVSFLPKSDKIIASIAELLASLDR